MAIAAISFSRLNSFLKQNSYNDQSMNMNWAYTAVVAEWLRRLTRNQFPSGSVGSNPTDCENFFVCVNYDIWKMLSATVSNSTFAIQHRWFSGRMLACHAGGPGSIPGRCKLFLANCSNKNISKVVEAPGIDPGTSRMLSERSTI